MASLDELRTELATVQAKLDELSALPTSGRVGKTQLSTAKTIEALERRRSELQARIVAQGTRGPRRRTLA